MSSLEEQFQVAKAAVFLLPLLPSGTNDWDANSYAFSLVISASLCLTKIAFDLGDNNTFSKKFKSTNNRMRQQIISKLDYITSLLLQVLFCLAIWRRISLHFLFFFVLSPSLLSRLWNSSSNTIYRYQSFETVLVISAYVGWIKFLQLEDFIVTSQQWKGLENLLVEKKYHNSSELTWQYKLNSQGQHTRKLHSKNAKENSVPLLEETICHLLTEGKKEKYLIHYAEVINKTFCRMAKNHEIVFWAHKSSVRKKRHC